LRTHRGCEPRGSHRGGLRIRSRVLLDSEMSRALLALLAFAAIVAGAPWIAYEIGLANVDGRPTPPFETGLTVEQTEFLHVAMRKAGAFSVVPLSPWDYALDRLREPEKLTSGGMKATEIVAADYTSAHLRRSTPAVLRELSETALTIWLTHEWKTD